MNPKAALKRDPSAPMVTAISVQGSSCFFRRGEYRVPRATTSRGWPCVSHKKIHFTFSVMVIGDNVIHNYSIKIINEYNCSILLHTKLLAYCCKNGLRSDAVSTKACLTCSGGRKFGKPCPRFRALCSTINLSISSLKQVDWVFDVFEIRWAIQLEELLNLWQVL